MWWLTSIGITVGLLILLPFALKRAAVNEANSEPLTTGILELS